MIKFRLVPIGYKTKPHEKIIMNKRYIISSEGYVAFFRQYGKKPPKKIIKKLSGDNYGKKIIAHLTDSKGEKIQLRMNRTMAEHFMPNFNPENLIGFLDPNREDLLKISNLFQYKNLDLFFYKMYHHLIDKPTEKQIRFYDDLANDKMYDIDAIETNNPLFDKIVFD